MSCYSEAQLAKFRLIKQGKIKGKTYVSFSGGKDSTAMLLMLIKKGIHFDEIVFADTHFEYPELYMFIDYFKKTQKINITKISCDLKTWDKWFYGANVKGKSKGTIRGYPLVLSPCWYKREAKVKPLQDYMRDASTIYVGIAYDEKRRHNDKDSRIKHPLVDWKMTEKDCAKYLQKKGLHNPIYDNYNRSGCYQCQKQNEWGLYRLWCTNKILWSKVLFMDNESRRVRGTGGFIDYKTKSEIVISELQTKFESGYIPDKNLKYECQSCKVFV